MMPRAARAAAAMVVAAALSLLGAGVASAVDLRGRIDGRNPYNGAFYPLGNAEVQLVFGGRIVMRTITGYDGFYYFRNAGPGPHQIVVNRSLRVNVTIFNRQYQDIAPILFAPR
jgi:hypothetical protein